jgi:hypothetical protein
MTYLAAENVLCGCEKGGRMTRQYTDDADLFRLMKAELFTAVVGDVLDKMEIGRASCRERV